MILKKNKPGRQLGWAGAFRPDPPVNRGKRSVRKISWNNNHGEHGLGQYISDISSKATKTLGFLRRNLAFTPRSTKDVAYKTLICP